MYRTLLATCGSAERHCAQRKGTALSGKALRSAERHVTKEVVPMSEIVSASRLRINWTAPANQSDRARGPLTRYRSRMGICRGGKTKRHSLITECLRQSHKQRLEKSGGRGVRTWQVIQKNGNEKHKKRNARNWHILRVENFEPPIG